MIHIFDTESPIINKVRSTPVLCGAVVIIITAVVGSIVLFSSPAQPGQAPNNNDNHDSAISLSNLTLPSGLVQLNSPRLYSVFVDGSGGNLSWIFCGTINKTIPIEYSGNYSISYAFIEDDDCPYHNVTVIASNSVGEARIDGHIDGVIAIITQPTVQQGSVIDCYLHVSENDTETDADSFIVVMFTSPAPS